MNQSFQRIETRLLKNWNHGNNMISYELAKKLRDHGFPQKGNPICICGNSFNSFPDCKHIGDDYVVVPTLSELVEECVKYLFSQFSLEQHSNDWRAGVYRSNRQYAKQFSSGKTPQEAVANLWLLLNQKF